MFSKIIRLGLTAGILAWSIQQFTQNHIGNGIFLLLPMSIVLFTYFRNERILLSLWHMRKNNVAKAEKALTGIRNPEKSLIRSQLAY